MSDEVSMLEWAFKGIVGVLLAVGAGIWGWLMTKVNGIEKDFIDHRIYSEQTFAKIDSVNESFDRLHQCIDDMQKNMQSMSTTQATLAANMANMASNLQNITSSLHLSKA